MSGRPKLKRERRLASLKQLAGADFLERLATAAARPDFLDNEKVALGEGPQVMGGVETPDDV